MTHYPASIPDDINGTKLLLYPILYFSLFIDFKSLIMSKTSLTCLSNLLPMSSSNSLFKSCLFWSYTLSCENMIFTFPVYHVKYALLSLIWTKLSAPSSKGWLFTPWFEKQTNLVNFLHIHSDFISFNPALMLESIFEVFLLRKPTQSSSLALQLYNLLSLKMFPALLMSFLKSVIKTEQGKIHGEKNQCATDSPGMQLRFQVGAFPVCHRHIPTFCNHLDLPRVMQPSGDMGEEK